MPPDSTAKKYLQSYLAKLPTFLKQGKGLMIHGPASRGKSALAAVCLKYAACLGVIGYWLRAVDLVEAKINNVMFDSSESVIGRCLSVPMLVLDDVWFRHGEDKFTGYYTDEVVRQRRDKKLVTIITTNHTMEELKAAHSSFYEIWKECGWALKVDEYDFRGDKDKLLVNRDGTTKF